MGYFHPRKSITTGEGGMITTNKRLASRLRGLRNHVLSQRRNVIMAQNLHSS